MTKNVTARVTIFALRVYQYESAYPIHYLSVSVYGLGTIFTDTQVYDIARSDLVALILHHQEARRARR